MRIIQRLKVPTVTSGWNVAVQNRTTKQWFLAQSRMKSSGIEDSVYHRFDEKGLWLDSMTQVDGGHPTAFGVTPSNVIYTTHHDGPGGNPWGIVKFKYVPDTTVTYKDVKIVKVPFPALTQISLSPSGGWACLREIKKENDVYRRYKLSELDKGDFKAYGNPVYVSRATDEVMQGFGLSNATLTVVRGYVNKPVKKYTYSFETGQNLSVLDVTKDAFYPDEEMDFYEAEGVDGGRIGVKVHKGLKRELRILA